MDAVELRGQTQAEYYGMPRNGAAPRSRYTLSAFLKSGLIFHSVVTGTVTLGFGIFPQKEAGNRLFYIGRVEGILRDDRMMLE